MALDHADIGRPIRLLEVAGEANSVKTLDDLKAFIRDQLVHHLQDADAVAVPRGLIDRKKFRAPNGWPIVSNALRPALFHVHDAVCLFPSELQCVPTILSSARNVGEAVLRTIHSPKWENLSRSFHARKMLEEIKVYATSGLAEESMPATNKCEAKSPRDCLVHAAKQLENLPWNSFLIGRGHCQKGDDFALVHDVQQAADPIAMDWLRYDFGIIQEEILHARDIRTRTGRHQNEILRFMPLYTFIQ